VSSPDWKRKCVEIEQAAEEIYEEISGSAKKQKYQTADETEKKVKKLT
jgi:hypothetical protein